MQKCANLHKTYVMPDSLSLAIKKPRLLRAVSYDCLDVKRCDILAYNSKSS